MSETAFDPNAMRERYRVERDKRLRDDGNEQYVEIKGRFAHYLDDPYVDQPIRRDPVTDEGGIGNCVTGAIHTGSTTLICQSQAQGIDQADIKRIRILCRSDCGQAHGIT